MTAHPQIEHTSGEQGQTSSDSELANYAERTNVRSRATVQPGMSDFGLQGVNYVLGGGFPTNSVYLLTGDPGTFYATFAQQALNNVLKQNVKVVYYISEASSEDIIQDMSTFKWDIRKPIEDGSWIFTRVVPPQLKTIVNDTPADPKEQRIDLPAKSLLALRQDFLSKLNEGRWSAISLSYLMKTYPIDEITDLVMFWVNAAHRLGGVHFILVPKGVHDSEDINYIKLLVDGVLSFKFAQGFEQAEGEIDIEKLRRVIPKVKIIRHAVQDNGLVIETSARVG